MSYRVYTRLRKTNFLAALIIPLLLVLALGCNATIPEKHDHGTMSHSEINHADMKDDSMSGMDHSSHGKPATDLYAGSTNAVTKTSKNGNYKVTLYSDVAPIPIQKIHTWTVHIEDKNGKPFAKEDGKVFVFGGMPAHRHGFPTKPTIKEYLGNGDYKVEGIKFNMHGAWEMRFNIQVGRGTDRVIFDIDL